MDLTNPSSPMGFAVYCALGILCSTPSKSEPPKPVTAECTRTGKFDWQGRFEFKCKDGTLRYSPHSEIKRP